MALQMDLTLENTTNYPNGYLVITELEFLYKDVNCVNILLSLFVTKEAYDNGAPPVVNFKHTCSGNYFNIYFSEAYLSMENNTPLKCAYEYLKSLETYFNAIEV